MDNCEVGGCQPSSSLGSERWAERVVALSSNELPLITAGMALAIADSV